jgi:myo-inositol 2-dehydrogenase / D-chiro-inositol 1-dehydrogenase
MPEIRIALVGAGFMARRRARAFLATGRARVCGIASRHLERARLLGQELGCEACCDDFRSLTAQRPDAVLVEVPHAAQDAVVGWALTAGLHVLIGAPLSYSVAGGEAILAAAERSGLVVEAGFEARYKAAWETARDLLARGEIGRLAAVRTVALWDGRPESWYYDERQSGGMPLTHMTYTFLNPLRWLLGEPTHVSAFANRIKHTAPHHVREETCVASLLFPGEVLASVTAGYVRAAEGAFWDATFLGTKGVLEVFPTEMDAGSLRLSRGREMREMGFAASRDAFEVQAEAFLDALAGHGACRNGPAAALGDLRLAEAIALSAREKRTIALAPASTGGSGGLSAEPRSA